MSETEWIPGESSCTTQPIFGTSLRGGLLLLLPQQKILIILENPSTRETETEREDEEEEDDNNIERLGAHGRKPLRKTSNLHTDRILVSWRTRIDSTATKIQPLFPAKTRYRSHA
jgi:hypothetical protein